MVMKDVAEEIKEVKDMEIDAKLEVAIKETSYAAVEELRSQINHGTDLCPACEAGSQANISSDTMAAECACQVFDERSACKVFDEIPVQGSVKSNDSDNACPVFEEIHAFIWCSKCSQRKL